METVNNRISREYNYRHSLKREIDMMTIMYVFVMLITILVTSTCLAVAFTINVDAAYQEIRVEELNIEPQPVKTREVKKNESITNYQKEIDEYIESHDFEVMDLVHKRQSSFDVLISSFGQPEIKIDGVKFISHSLPDIYYPNMDFSSFQPYMDYKYVTNESSPAYKVCHSENAYTDENGLRRMKVEPGQFTVNKQDDYIVALGTFYKDKGTAGTRYLVVTSTGMYTIIAGDEKADAHTEQYHMMTIHNGKGSMIEWIVDTPELDPEIRRSGTVTNAPVDAFKGEIRFIYEIIE